MLNFSEESVDRADETLLEQPFTADCLALLRALVESTAAKEGVDDDRLGEFVLAVDEIACNAVEHAGGSGHLVLRRVDGALECLISDTGPGFTPELPEAPPDLDSTGGRGLWLARLLTDRLTITTGAAGAVVTLLMYLP
ncbi:ATP-binding protein [Streptomyces sp. NPDC085900]|uniref:ATP-binding protein n=1 Tax=Streptomyces sp. NPDC085900 TaxID=3365737 RepID=UPI0037D3CA29